MAPDHLNYIERVIIDNLRTGTYKTGVDPVDATAWSNGSVKVFGQFPEPEEAQYPCLVVQMVSNGIEEQFLGQHMSVNQRGELYGAAFQIHAIVDSESTLDNGTGSGFKQRKLLNYMMLSVANIITDCTFDPTSTEIVSRFHTGFKEIGYDPTLELFAATTGMIIVFKNNR
jgi:hypothetical protein|tara:strand:+ start:1433 stop:1945 length:513 start_codon:yes stop_codon:yes gene_type:complete